jgi:hypothetical protein
LWHVGLDWIGSQNPLWQPALVNALANWWGGDTTYFAPCMAPHPFRATFDPGGCPLDQDLLLTNGWSVVQDISDPTNHVLEGSGTPSTAFGVLAPAIGASDWTDYTVRLRLRLMPGVQPRADVAFREGPDGNSYSIAIGYGSIALNKLNRTQGLYPMLASYQVPGGTQPGQWYDLEVIANGTSITVKLNGAVVIQASDQSGAYLLGGIRLGVGSGAEPATADFDDIAVEVISATP